MRATPIICGLCLVAFSAAHAQRSPIQKGSIQIGGTADVSHTEPDGNGSGLTIIEAFPRVGYFVVNGLSINLNLRLRRVTADDISSARDQRSTELGIGPGVSYYFRTPARRLFPFVSGRMLYNQAKTHLTLLPSETEVDTRTTSTVWLAGGGVLYMLGEHVGLTSELFYQWNRNKIKNQSAPEISQKSKTYGIQWGVAAFIF